MDSKPPVGVSGVGVKGDVGGIALTKTRSVKVGTAPIRVAVLRGVGVIVGVNVGVLVRD